jgi:hypothetical protein
MIARIAAVASLALACAAPAQAATPNLLRNASWEEDGFAGWSFPAASVSTETRTAPGEAREGDRFGVVRTGARGGYFGQLIGVSPREGTSYSFSLWVRSATGAPVNGKLGLWSLGREDVATPTDFVAGPEWTLVSAPLEVSEGGLGMQAEVTVHTPGATLQVDGAQVIDAGLGDASFDKFIPFAWAFPPRGEIDMGGGSGPYRAREGRYVGSFGTQVAGRSLGQDVDTVPQPGRTYVFSIWLKSESGRAFSGRVELSTLGGALERGATPFAVRDEWTLVSAPLTVSAAGHTGMRAEVVMNTTGDRLEVDAAQLVDTGLANASFEQGAFAGWASFPFGPLVAASSGAGLGTGREGAGLGSVRTATPGRAFAQNLSAVPASGESHTFSAWVRSPSGAPVAGAVTLRALGGSEEVGTTPFAAGERWKLVSAPLSIARDGHSALRAEVVVNTIDAELQVDGASTASGNARDGGSAAPPVAPPENPRAGSAPANPPAPAPPPPAPRLSYIDATVSARFVARRTYTRVARLAVRRAPAGGRVELRCRGRGCPTRRAVTRRGVRTTSFTKLFRGRRLRPGARIELRVLAPGRVGQIVRYRVRAGRRPAADTLCLVPGATRVEDC